MLILLLQYLCLFYCSNFCDQLMKVSASPSHHDMLILYLRFSLINLSVKSINEIVMLILDFILLAFDCSSLIFSCLTTQVPISFGAAKHDSYSGPVLSCYFKISTSKFRCSILFACTYSRSSIDSHNFFSIIHLGIKLLEFINV